MKQIEKISSYQFELSLLSCIMHLFLDFCSYGTSDKSALKCSRITFLKSKKAFYLKTCNYSRILIIGTTLGKADGFELSGGLKNGFSNITVFDWGSAVRFASNNLEFRKTEGSRNQDCIVV